MSNFISTSGFLGQFIAGQHRAGRQGDVLRVSDPYDNSLLAEFITASLDDVNEAFSVAELAQKSWASKLPSERSAVFHRAAAVMDKYRTDIVDLIIRETGGTHTKANAEWAATRAGMMEAAELPMRVEGRIMPINVPGKESRVYRVPLGVVSVISPWNVPLHLSNRSAAPALALGNAVVIKPSEETPICGGLLLAKIYQEAGLPDGLLNVVNGDIPVIGDAFTLHPVARFLSFTGSERAGRAIASRVANSPTLKHIALELGGNSPLLVLDDADIEQAVRAAVMGRFLHQGQVCMSTNRIIVDKNRYEEFTELFVEHVSRLKFGDPKEVDTVIGPLINARQLQAAQALVAQAKASGLRQLLGGEAQGQVLPPHVFAPVPEDSPLAQTELFSPIAQIFISENDRHAVQMANNTSYGLSSAIFSKDEGRALQLSMQIEAGMVHINDITVNDSPFNMFGGVKNSGLGRFNGEWSVASYTEDRWVTIQRTPLHYPF